MRRYGDVLGGLPRAWYDHLSAMAVERSVLGLGKRVNALNHRFVVRIEATVEHQWGARIPDICLRVAASFVEGAKLPQLTLFPGRCTYVL